MVFINTLDPILVTIPIPILGSLAIHWYSIMYIIGILFAYWYIHTRIKTKKTILTIEQLDTLMFWLLIALIVGARIFEVVFWQWSYISSNPWKIFFVWEGGLSFHGGLAAMILTAVLLAKKFKLSFGILGDLVIVPAALGQAFGRIGNFFNHELYGKITTLPWGVNFNNEIDTLGNLVFRHPNQLYEVGYDLIIFGILFALRNKNFKHGTLLALFLILYGFFRFFTEFLRANEVLHLGLTMGQWFNIVMIIVGAWWVWKLYKGKKELK